VKHELKINQSVSQSINQSTFLIGLSSEDRWINQRWLV